MTIENDTTACAQAHSNALVAQAQAYVDKLLSDPTWIANNRHIALPGGEYALWNISGCNQLTLEEQHKLRNAYLKQGWAKVELTAQPHRQPGHWGLRFFL